MYGELSASRTRRTVTATARLLRALHLDGMLLSALVAVSVFGMFVLYSAAGDNLSLWLNQLARLGIGFGVMFALAQVPDHFLRMLSPAAFAAGLLLLASSRSPATSARARSAGSTSASSGSSRPRS